MKKFMNEFKEFISRGNVMDMAVGYHYLEVHLQVSYHPW